MAITDILERLAADAAAEIAGIRERAEAEANAISAHVAQTVAREREIALEVARREAEAEAATMLANARLGVRDRMLAQKRALAESVLEAARERVVSLPDAEYAGVVARAVVHATTGGERLLVAPADAGRLRDLPSLLEAAGVAVRIDDEPATIDRGVLLLGDRTHVEVSPRAMVADRRDELVSIAVRVLFGEKG